MKPNPAQERFVEIAGRWFEGVGPSRTAGRILGWLMVCEPPHQSASDLVEALSVSTGSVSTLARQLERLGLVERITFLGNRAAYYQIPEKVWSNLMWAEKERIGEMRRLVDAASDVMPSSRQDRITELAHVVDFFTQEWPGLMDRFARYLETESV